MASACVEQCARQGMLNGNVHSYDMAILYNRQTAGLAIL
jgi:hypothetical protein